MKSFFTFLFLSISVFSFSQRNTKKLESSFDFGFGNHFGLKQIEDGFKVNALTANNLTIGWTNYFTNYKIGGRLELSYDKMVGNSLSVPFHTNYFRSTYYLNASLKNLVGWGKSNNSVDKKTFWQSFDIDLGMGLGYSAMTNKEHPVSYSPFLKSADDMLNISFRIAPSIEVSEGIKLFASYTRINHSSQSTTFDFTNPIANTAFKGAFRTLNVGIRYTPNTERIYNRQIKESHKKWHFFTSFDASMGNHFAGKTKTESVKFNGSSLSHLNLGLNHKYPNSRLSGRFDLGFDVFKETKNSPAFTSKYFRTTYQVIADMRTLRGVNNESNKMDLAFGVGVGFATMYDSKSSTRLSDIFLNGDDMYALVFSVNPSYRISNYLSVISNLTLTSHSLQSSAWDMQSGQSNSALNGRFMNLSVGLRYHVADRRTNYTTEIVNRVPRIWSIDAAVGSHFAGAPLQSNSALSATPGKHIAVGLNHPFINPIYFGRFEFAYDALGGSKSSPEFSSKYFRANYFLMTSVQKQLSKSLSSGHVPGAFDVQFGVGAGASTVQTKGHNDYFISKGDDMLNLALKVVPTYQVSKNVSVFAAYTFVSHSLESMTYDMNQSVDKTMFNGHLMNASVGVSVTLKSTKARSFVEVVPVVDTIQILQVTDVNPPADTTHTVEPDPIVTVTPDPEVIPTPTDPTRTLINTISGYPVNMSVVPLSEKEELKAVAAQLKANPLLTLVVSGHADVSGSEGYNLALSRNRAANVKAYIISQGVPANRIKIEYYGSSKPVDTNDTIEGRMKNRRVDIELVTPGTK